MQPITDPAEIDTPQEKIQATINEVKGFLIGFNETIGFNVESGVWTSDEAQGYLDKSRTIRLQLDLAQAAVGTGDWTTAEAQIALAYQLMNKLREEANKELIDESSSGVETDRSWDYVGVRCYDACTA